MAGPTVPHHATQNRRRAVAATHRRGRDRVAGLPARRPSPPHRAALPTRLSNSAQNEPGGLSPMSHARRSPEVNGCHRGIPSMGTAKRTGHSLPGVHCLRHSFAVHLLRSGLSLKTIGDLLGHRSVESTCVYLRLATDDLRDVALASPAGASLPHGAGARTMKARPAFTSPLAPDIVRYLTLKRALGREYRRRPSRARARGRLRDRSRR